MSDVIVGAVVGAIAALAGAVISFALDWIRRSQERRLDTIKALQSERANAYRQFISKAHQAMHAMAAVSEPGAHATPEARTEAMALVNREGRAALYELEIVAEEATIKAAWALHEVLRAFRDKLVRPGVTTDTEDWKTGQTTYWAARRRFIELARVEILHSRVGRPQDKTVDPADTD